MSSENINCGSCEPQSPQSSRSLFPVTRIYTDENGDSRFGVFHIEMNNDGAIGLLSRMIPCTSVMFRETPPTYNFSWHNAPRRLFIVNLDADVEITVSTGETQIIKQGDVFFVEDTNGKGHFSKSVGAKLRHSLFIIVPDDYHTPTT